MIKDLHVTYINGELLSFTAWSSCTGNDVTKSPFSINAPKSDWSNVIWKHQSYALLTLCDGNPPVTGGFPSQRISHTESDFMSWRHHSICFIYCMSVAPEQAPSVDGTSPLKQWQLKLAGSWVRQISEQASSRQAEVEKTAVSLQWHHMSDMASRITGTRFFFNCLLGLTFMLNPLY